MRRQLSLYRPALRTSETPAIWIQQCSAWSVSTSLRVLWFRLGRHRTQMLWTQTCLWHWPAAKWWATWRQRIFRIHQCNLYTHFAQLTPSLMRSMSALVFINSKMQTRLSSASYKLGEDLFKDRTKIKKMSLVTYLSLSLAHSTRIRRTHPKWPKWMKEYSNWHARLRMVQLRSARSRRVWSYPLKATLRRIRRTLAAMLSGPKFPKSTVL